MPIRGRLRGLPIGVAAALLTAAALAADPDAFLAGTTKICADCDLAARDLKERDLKRAKLDRAKLRNADLTGASLFRASLVRADLIGAKLKDANLNLVDAKWADLTGADLRERQSLAGEPAGRAARAFPPQPSQPGGCEPHARRSARRPARRSQAQGRRHARGQARQPESAGNGPLRHRLYHGRHGRG